MTKNNFRILDRHTIITTNEERQMLKDAAVKIVEDRIIEIGSKEELLASNPKASVVGSENFIQNRHMNLFDKNDDLPLLNLM